MNRPRRFAFFASALAAATVAAVSAGTALAGSYSVTVTGTTAGLTETNIGAVEACSRFNTSDMTDLGIKNFRIYGGMSRLEPVDDDGVYGSPSIAQIKANPNIIPWTVWDQEFTRPDAYFWTNNCLSTGTTSLKDMLTQLNAAGITPVFTTRNVDNGKHPAWAQQLNPPIDTAGQNEWWEHVFATVYSIDVRYGLDVNDWEVHNEPDNSGQGWGGTLAQYEDFVRLTNDAISYVYATFLPGKTYKLYAPVSAQADSWIPTTLQQNGSIVNVIDWHDYGDPVVNTQQVNSWIDQYSTVHDPQYLGEWGSYRGAYRSVSDALTYSNQLLDHSLPTSHLESSAIFSLYDWSNTVTGLVAMDGTRHEPYWALRLMIRGLQGGKQEYAMSNNFPGTLAISEVAAKDQTTGTLYVELVNQSNTDQTISLNLSAFATTGTVTFRQYSSAVKDAVTGTGTITNGTVTFTLPKQSIVQVIK